MSDNTIDDFSPISAALLAHLKTAIPQMATVAAYEPYKPGQEGVIDSPALLLEVINVEPGGRVSGGRFPVIFNFAVHCILSTKTPEVSVQAVNLALRVEQVIDNNRWGFGESMEIPKSIEAFPGVFKPDDKGFESWVVTWKQVAHLGTGNTLPDFLPTQVLMGEYPNTGADHEGDYQGEP